MHPQSPNLGSRNCRSGQALVSNFRSETGPARAIKLSFTHHRYAMAVEGKREADRA
jgi:hypothetical protein